MSHLWNFSWTSNLEFMNCVPWYEMVKNIPIKNSNLKFPCHVFQVLSKTILELSEIEWLDACLEYFYPYAKKIYKQHRGHVTGEKVKKKHVSFLNKFIDPAINAEHNRGKYICGECSENFTSFDVFKKHVSHHYVTTVKENTSREDLVETEITQAGKYLELFKSQLS